MDRCAGNDGAGWVGDRAAHSAGVAALAGAERREEKGEEREECEESCRE
jgi:hypothetical protein